MVYCAKHNICNNCPNIPGCSECDNCCVQEVCLEQIECEGCPLYEAEDEGEDYD